MNLFGRQVYDKFLFLTPWVMKALVKLPSTIASKLSVPYALSVLLQFLLTNILNASNSKNLQMLKVSYFQIKNKKVLLIKILQ